MMTANTLEETLKGGFSGLYGEVVTQDSYRLKQIHFQPTLVFDIGANVGIFSRYARTLFPEAKIIAVEPNPSNCANFKKFTKDSNLTLLECALGKGDLFHGLTARNGSGETYLSAGLGYPLSDMNRAVLKDQGLEFSTVASFTLYELIMANWSTKDKTLIKIDCEGGENTIWEHAPSMSALRRMDYICMEIHFYALTGAEHPKVVEATHQALRSLEQTHDCELQGVHFWATKKV